MLLKHNNDFWSYVLLKNCVQTSKYRIFKMFFISDRLKVGRETAGQFPIFLFSYFYFWDNLFLLLNILPSGMLCHMPKTMIMSLDLSPSGSLSYFVSGVENRGE